jgi:hypothetical protein
MFGRKAKRIAELEAALRDERENRVNVTLRLPHHITHQMAGLPLGQWYRLSFRFQVADKEGTAAFADMGLFQDDTPGPYFDGAVSGGGEWVGKVPTKVQEIRSIPCPQCGAGVGEPCIFGPREFTTGPRDMSHHRTRLGEQWPGVPGGMEKAP